LKPRPKAPVSFANSVIDELSVFNSMFRIPVLEVVSTLPGPVKDV
jgi:hypothetical protein